MRKLALATLALLMPLTAHHAYQLFYAVDQEVILRGRVSSYVFSEPHVMLTVETKNSGTWKAEWTNPSALRRQGIDQTTLHPGDELEIHGSPALNPAFSVVSALFDLRRPSDNWHWHRDSASIQPGNQPRTIE